MKEYVKYIIENCSTKTVKELEKETGIANSYIRSILAKKGLSAAKHRSRRAYRYDHEACPITGLKFY